MPLVLLSLPLVILYSASITIHVPIDYCDSQLLSKDLFQTSNPKIALE